MKDELDGSSLEDQIKALPKRWIEFQIEKCEREIKQNESYISLLKRMLHEKEKVDN